MYVQNVHGLYMYNVRWTCTCTCFHGLDSVYLPPFWTLCVSMGLTLCACVCVSPWSQVLRSVKASEGELISLYYYLPFALRSFAVFTGIKLFLRLKLPLSLNEMLGKIK